LELSRLRDTVLGPESLPLTCAESVAVVVDRRSIVCSGVEGSSRRRLARAERTNHPRAKPTERAIHT
jgi:hypothetical protein